MKWARRLGLGVIVLAALAYSGVVLGMYVMQRSLQYDTEGAITALASTTIVGAQNVAIASDGGTLAGWYAPPRPGKPLIVYYKGNSGSFSHEHERFERWSQDGYGFLAFDYRGFPASPGNVSQAGILDDAVAAFNWAKAKGFPIVIWGRSLGSGPATFVASEREADALLLETPFLSAVNVAAERYPFLPVYWVMQDQFPVNEWIAKVSEPVLIAHGTADTTIDVSNGERLYDLVPNKDELWIVPGERTPAFGMPVSGPTPSDCSIVPKRQTAASYARTRRASTSVRAAQRRRSRGAAP
ncbi:alpha/beta hydrolase [Devosia rhodophyticola]|uniref:Alpha/beta hydrolase n=1 Tax=Devosia rhodophyticola TaxID=3026423 RepID=A0ABY7YUK7_9HYPH|nr:alpha/beta hydrolase [Devosia rhodophyticola]WDR04892.1 alpha/beta hydrolase [Devosia rhodophyticola]